MARPIKFRFTMINTQSFLGYSLRDCTVGTTYEGTFYGKGEEHPDGTCDYDVLEFTDDVGEKVVKYVLPQDLAYEEVKSGRPIKFRILRIYNRDLYASALQDCTVGTTYEGTLYDTGEIDSDGDVTRRPTIFFKDDAGDNVVKYIDHNFTYVEVV